MLKTNISIIVIFLFSFLFIFAFKVNSKPKDNFCLLNSYEAYKKNFMSQDGRIIDYDKGGITTSEGQSYMMLRSFIMEDKKTFDLVYKWSKNDLQRQDKLFAWLWGKNKQGEYGILDDNSASDADVDIAFALLMAYECWGKHEYLMEAAPIINSIWNYETKRIGEYLVLMPGAKQVSDEKIEINPSYFSPYAFKLFQKYDEIHDWDYLVDSSYYYLDEVMSKTQTNLPPNWFLIENGQVVLEDSERGDFSYDAIRVFPRIYLDYIETGDKRALPILEKSNFFVDKWKNSKTFYTNYRADGQLRDKVEFLGSIAVLLPIMEMYDKKTADEIYKEKLEQHIQTQKDWNAQKDYYSKNLSWFGMFLYEKHLRGCEIKVKKQNKRLKKDESE